MANQKWLERYYGKEFDFFNPSVAIDGNKKAVVKITRTASRGFNSVGFVLLDKTGTHASSTHKSLHEGMPSGEDMERMRKILEREDQ